MTNQQSSDCINVYIISASFCTAVLCANIAFILVRAIFQRRKAIELYQVRYERTAADMLVDDGYEEVQLSRRSAATVPNTSETDTMTIYKPNNSERKQEKKPMMVGPEFVIDDKQILTEKAGGNDGLLLVRRRPVTNMDVLRRSGWICCAMILLTINLVVEMALIVVVLFNSRILNSPYIGQYQVTLHENLTKGGEMALQVGGSARGSFSESYEVDVTYHENLMEGGEMARQVGDNARDSFSEYYEVDAGNGHYEKYAVPPVLDFRRSTVLHDFDKNLTSIVDRDNSRCFILPLNRTDIQPPKNFQDYLNKSKSGYYLPDAEIVRETYKVVLPPVSDVEQFGYYIWSDCQFFDTYRLIKTDQTPIVASKKKRSADCSMIGDGFCIGASLTNKITCISFSDCFE